MREIPNYSPETGKDIFCLARSAKALCLGGAASLLMVSTTSSAPELPASYRPAIEDSNGGNFVLTAAPGFDIISQPQRQLRPFQAPVSAADGKISIPAAVALRSFQRHENLAMPETNAVKNDPLPSNMNRAKERSVSQSEKKAVVKPKQFADLRIQAGPVKPQRTTRRPNLPKPRTAPPAPSMDKNGIFNTVELRFDDIDKIKAWQGSRHALKSDQTVLKHCIQNLSERSTSCGSDALRQWAVELHALKSLPRFEIIKAVNNKVNAISYRSDYANYGRSDYWARPEMMLTNGGDCEDYAMLKLASLAALGIENADMRLLVGHLSGGSPHVLLSVRQNGVEYILDNEINHIRPGSDSERVLPRYSMNYDYRWSHIRKRQAPPVKMASASAL